jgi:hypothetical protein
VVDCTAAGLASPPDRRVYDPDRITIQWIQAGIAPFSAALIGFVEASREDDTDKNRLCTARGFSRRADVVNYAAGWLNTPRGFLLWLAEPDLADWLSTCRLSAFGNAGPYRRSGCQRGLATVSRALRSRTCSDCSPRSIHSGTT